MTQDTGRRAPSLRAGLALVVGGVLSVQFGSAFAATLFPVIAMRPNIGTLPPGRGVSVTDEVSVTMVEVPDYYVRDYFEG